VPCESAVASTVPARYPASRHNVTEPELVDAPIGSSEP